MPKGFQINKQGIARFTRELQREFDRHPIRVPVQAEQSPMLGFAEAAGGDINNYYGPVIHGDANNAQLAWMNGSASQTQANPQQVAAGYETLAAAVATLLQQIPDSGIGEDVQERIQGPATELLNEVVEAEPNRSKVRAALERIQGLLAPVAIGLSRGAGDGATEWAKEAISQLDVPF
ncbi:hypothetical protein ACQPXM_06580 [Kribbella sp. CA-253562]|uniref:hypothetical protein n=1 Tax=Kribbella sp. CA-253562 TaxID=3239942 RepID=UPI003D9502CE